MKKAIFIIAIFVIAVALLYLISNTVLDSQINKNILSLKQSGYATTIKEIEPVATQENKKAGEILTTAFQEITKGSEDEQNRRDRNLTIADSINFEDNLPLFNQIIAENKKTIDLLLEAAKYPQANFGFKYQDGFNAKIPEPIPALAKFCRLLRIYAKKLIAEGKTEKALNVLRQTVHLANIPQDNTGLFHLIKAYVMTNTFKLIQTSASKASIASIESLIPTIENIDLRASLKQGMLNELIIGIYPLKNDKNFAQLALDNLENITTQKRIILTLLRFGLIKKYEEFAIYKNYENLYGTLKITLLPIRIGFDTIREANAKPMEYPCNEYGDV